MNAIKLIRTRQNNAHFRQILPSTQRRMNGQTDIKHEMC